MLKFILRYKNLRTFASTVLATLPIKISVPGRVFCFLLQGTPKLLSKPPYSWVNNVPIQTQKLYLHLCIMRYMLNIIVPHNRFNQELAVLLAKYPSVDPDALDIKEGWQEEPLWR